MKNLIPILTIVLLVSVGLQAQTLPEFVKVTGGTFTMGDEWGLGYDDEQPTHEVTLSGFSISKTEVTVAQYRRYCNATGVSMPDDGPSWVGKDNHPIVLVSWYDAINYCDWLSEELDQNILLPTEAQWEFAARGGNHSNGYKYSGSRSMATAGWYKGNSNGKTHTVATKKANELGLYDMSGNVWEWCMDKYAGNYYANSPSQNPKGPQSGDTRDSRVLRGGSWYNEATYCRVSNRNSRPPEIRNDDYGFRVVSFHGN